MRRLIVLGIMMLAVPCAAPAAPLAYPVAPREDTGDTLFGIRVEDPFRWLEQPLRESARVRDWVAAENRLTRAYIDSLPDHAAIARCVASLWNIEKLSAPQARGSKLFYNRNSGIQDQSVIYVRDGLRGTPRILLDPNGMKDGTSDIVVQDWRVSDDGRWLLYSTQVNGGDQRTMRILDVATGRTLPDRVTGLKAPLYAWVPDGSGFYYHAFDAAAGDALTSAASRSAMYFHRIGDPQSADVEIHRDPAPVPTLVIPAVSADGRWLTAIVANTGGIASEILAADRNTAGPLTVVAKGDGANWRFVGSHGGRLMFQTSAGAPMGRIIALDPAGGAEQTPQIVVPEARDPILDARLAGDEIVVRYLKVTDSVLRRFAIDGRPKGEIALPAHTVVDEVEARPGDSTLFYRASTMSRPGTIYRFDLATGRSTLLAAPKTSWNPDDYVIRQITATSKDGTRVPVTIGYRRDLDLSKGAPTALTGYGGFGISLGLEFYESRFAWMNMGGVFAMAHVRGGAEFGKDWYLAGRKGGRVRTFEDYIAATEELQREGITTPAKTVAIGASNGGILVTAATNMRPDLYAAVLPRVPMTDMIRFTRFTLGKLFTDEFGDPDKADEFAFLHAYSPLHNVRGGRTYPAILVTTADTDDRVVPAHSFKYAATLQAADIGPKPHLIRVEAGAGHGQGKTQSKLIEEFSDLWTFAAAQTGLKLKPGGP